MNETLQQLQTAQQTVEPRFRALRSASSALKAAAKLAAEDKADALPMQKALLKLEQAAEQLGDEALTRATASFRAETEQALEGLAFDFAKDLKEAFEAKGLTVTGRPPTLVIDPLVLRIDIAARKAQLFYGKEPLTRPLALSINAIVKAYEQQYKQIVQRDIDPKAFLEELKTAWQQLVEQRSRMPVGGRINLIEVYSKLVLNRQSARFWNAPSRGTFKDYQRPLFVRDLVLAQNSPAFEKYALRLGVATKSQAESASRSLWLPSSALDGEYYADITFVE